MLIALVWSHQVLSPCLYVRVNLKFWRVKELPVGLLRRKEGQLDSGSTKHKHEWK